MLLSLFETKFLVIPKEKILHSIYKNKNSTYKIHQIKIFFSNI